MNRFFLIIFLMITSFLSNAQNKDNSDWLLGKWKQNSSWAIINGKKVYDSSSVKIYLEINKDSTYQWYFFIENKKYGITGKWSITPDRINIKFYQSQCTPVDSNAIIVDKVNPMVKLSKSQLILGNELVLSNFAESLLGYRSYKKMQGNAP